MAKFTHLIPQNRAFADTERIGVYDPKGKPVGAISLGGLSHPHKGEKCYCFGALADLHITNAASAGNVSKALAFLHGEVDFTCICGDLTENGLDTELAQYRYLVDTYSPDTPVYAVSGEHDAAQGNLTDAMLRPFIGQPLYYAFEHHGDVFILCGVYAKETLFAPGQLQWLYETLEANRNKRCFLFFHVFPWGDCGNAGEKYTEDIFSGTQGSVFVSLLQHYKNVILFHGHSHLKFRLQALDVQANYSDALGYRSVHIPSLAMPWETDNGDDLYADAEGYLVEVYEKGIALRGRDFAREEYLPIATYWLDTAVEEVALGTYWDDNGIILTHREIPYIETTGTQYINTQYIPCSNTRVVADLCNTVRTRSNNIMGSQTSLSVNACTFAISTSYWRFGHASTYVTRVALDQNRHIVDMNRNVLSIDGQVAYTATAKTFTGAYPFCIGAIHQGTILYGKAKFYGCQIYEEDILVRDLVPAVKADGEIGMYDKRNHVFYTNAGTGAFVTD